MPMWQSLMECINDGKIVQITILSLDRSFIIKSNKLNRIFCDFSEVIFGDYFKYHSLKIGCTNEEWQCAFSAKRNCTIALLDIFRSLDNNQLSMLILLDFTKEFDRIKRRLLLVILHYIGFSDSAVLLKNSDLQGRQQAVILIVQCQNLFRWKPACLKDPYSVLLFLLFKSFD